MSQLDRIRASLARLPARTYLFAGWLVFVLACYPGYLSVDSALQFRDVRSGIYTDAHPALATLLWRAFEWAIAGPCPMLILQSGLLLFGLDALFRRLAPPRAAAVAAALVLLFPPVFAPMSAIWPESLMAGALAAAGGALIQPSRRWQIAGCALLVLACNCHFAALAAVVPLLALAPTTLGRWQRIAAIGGIAIAIEGGAVAADRILVDDDTFVLQQATMLPDTVAVLRRGHVTAVRSLDAALDGVPVIDEQRLREITGGRKDPSDWWGLAHGEHRAFDPVATEDEAWALFRSWRHAATRHPVAYVRHRLQLARRVVGWTEPPDPVFDDLGDSALLDPLLYRASPSTFEYGARAVVRGAASLGLFRPWLYLVIAIVLIAIVRRPLVRTFAASAIAYELAMILFAPGLDYRYSHWLVVGTCTAGVAAALARRHAPSR
jgi:hypothetical protein